MKKIFNTDITVKGNNIKFDVCVDEPINVELSKNMPYVGVIEFGTLDGVYVCRRPFSCIKMAFNWYVLKFNNKADALKAYAYWTDTTDLSHLV